MEIGREYRLGSLARWQLERWIGMRRYEFVCTWNLQRPFDRFVKNWWSFE